MRRFEPTLSAKIFSIEEAVTQKNMALLRFPLMGSIKYDGFRLVEYNGKMVTRSLKTLRNVYFNQQMAAFIARAAELGYKGMDGEVVVGAANDPNSMQNTMALTAKDGEPVFSFYLFDSYQHASKPFNERNQSMRLLYEALHLEFPWLQFVEQVTIHNMADLLAYEESILQQGYEGIMLRKPDGHYKMGRSTMRENLLMALKRFVDDEALILEMWPQLQNNNQATEDNLGRTARSSHKENLQVLDTMGTFTSQSLKFEKTFGLGGGKGVTDAFRLEVWRNPEQFQWRVATYYYQQMGVKERPRLCKWKSWRPWEDLDLETQKRFLALGLSHVCAEGAVCMVRPEYAPKLAA